jgi:CxxC motif-containing protein (DUF1111 family)
MIRLRALIFFVTVLLIAPLSRGSDPPTFGDPLAGLTPDQAAAFQAGKIEFGEEDGIDEGLGPVFNGRSCGECHSVPAVGGGSTRVETRFGTITNGAFDPLTQYGGSLIQDHAIGPADGSTHQFHAEVVPGEATIVAGRRTTPLFGLGLVNATDDSTFVNLALQESLLDPGAAGHVAYVTNVNTGLRDVGKFGWKNQVPSLLVFSGDAYLNEMGITNPIFPDESCPQGDCSELQFNPMPGLNDDGTAVRAFRDFMRVLAPPPRGPITFEVLIGQVLFSAIGCDSCHTPTLTTGSNAIAALDHQTYHPYSDFLLHNMGSLGDGIKQGDATRREMRTAPLWGLRMITTFLHDGRATTLNDAIVAHDGQGKGARDRFLALSSLERSYLRAFLKSL